MKKIVELTATENDELLNVIEQSANDNGFEIESIGDVLDLVKVVADALKYMGIEVHVKWVDDEDEDASNSPEYLSVASDAVDKAKDAAEDVADAAKDVLNNISDAVKDVTE